MHMPGVLKDALEDQEDMARTISRSSFGFDGPKIGEQMLTFSSPEFKRM
jgi:hypothetical protein